MSCSAGGNKSLITRGPHGVSVHLELGVTAMWSSPDSGSRGRSAAEYTKDLHCQLLSKMVDLYFVI